MCATLVDSEGAEARNNGTRPKTAQAEIIKWPESKEEVNNVLRCNSKIEAMIDENVARRRKEMIAKSMSAPVA